MDSSIQICCFVTHTGVIYLRTFALWNAEPLVVSDRIYALTVMFLICRLYIQLYISTTDLYIVLVVVLIFLGINNSWYTGSAGISTTRCRSMSEFFV